MTTNPESLSQKLLEYFSVGNVALRTLQALSHYLCHRDAPLASSDAEALSLALDQVGEAREGFHLTLRATSFSSLEEMQSLVHRLLMDPDWIQELGLDILPEEEVAKPQRELLNFAHAWTSLAIIPRLPQALVTYPQDRPTYRDIPFPRSPGELLGRLQEVEEVAYQVLAAPRSRVPAASLRRTYGFFEASGWLASHHLRLFAKKPGDALP